jgi:hypothetical protein
MLPVAARFYHAPIGRSILYRMCRTAHRCSPQSMRHSSLYTGRCTVFCYFKNVCAARSLYQPKHLQLPLPSIIATRRLHNSWHAIIVRCLGTWTTADFESIWSENSNLARLPTSIKTTDHSDTGRAIFFNYAHHRDTDWATIISPLFRPPPQCGSPE